MSSGHLYSPFSLYVAADVVVSVFMILQCSCSSSHVLLANMTDTR